MLVGMLNIMSICHIVQGKAEEATVWVLRLIQILSMYQLNKSLSCQPADIIVLRSQEYKLFQGQG